MKNLLVLVCVLYCFDMAAQKPISPDFRQERKLIRADQKLVLKRCDSIKSEQKALALAYKGQEDDSLFQQKETALQEERMTCCVAGMRQIHDRKDAVIDQQEAFIRELKAYHKTQPYFDYNRKSKVNMVIGIGLVSVGGATLIAGFFQGIGEPVAGRTAEDNKRENVMVLTCIISGAAVAFSSLPFFRAATKNSRKYKSYTTWNLKVDSILMPNGKAGQTLGVNCSLPLFAKRNIWF